MRKAKLQFYRDEKREWRWRLRVANGRIIADGAEGYRRLASAREGAGLVQVLMGDVNQILWEPEVLS